MADPQTKLVEAIRAALKEAASHMGANVTVGAVRIAFVQEAEASEQDGHHQRADVFTAAANALAVK